MYICIDTVFGARSDDNPLWVSSFKGSLGHLLGAAGAVEAAFTAMALRDGALPPTLHLSTVNAQPTPKHFRHVVVEDEGDKGGLRVPGLRFAMKNSFGFGGTNAVLLLAKFKP